MSAGNPITGPNTLTLILRSLHSRNYRLFFTGQLISLVGSWLTTTATLWLVSRLTHNDTFILGMVGFAGQIPAFALAPLAGVLVDRMNLHRTLIVTQVLSLLQSAALATLVFLKLSDPMMTVHILLGLLIFQGVINSFDMPARQSFVVHMVDDPHDLPNAIALNSSMFNLARLLGPATAGVLIFAVGEALCFTIDAVSYIAVIIGLLMMRLPKQKKPPRKNVMQEFKDGLKYTVTFPPIRTILMLLALVSLVGVPYTILMPLFASDILHGNSMTYGLLTAATGAGALIGALRLAARKSVLGLGRVIPMATIGFGLSLIAFAYSRTIYISLPLMAVTGFCMVTQMASGNTLLQTIVDHDKRGRVMAFFGMSFQGMMPIGSLIVGAFARPDRLGPPLTLAICGFACILAACGFLMYLPTLRKYIRPIYVQRGILPQVASGLQAAETNPEPAAES